MEPIEKQCRDRHKNASTFAFKLAFFGFGILDYKLSFFTQCCVDLFDVHGSI